MIWYCHRSGAGVVCKVSRLRPLLGAYRTTADHRDTREFTSLQIFEREVGRDEMSLRIRKRIAAMVEATGHRRKQTLQCVDESSLRRRDMFDKVHGAARPKYAHAFGHRPFRIVHGA